MIEKIKEELSVIDDIIFSLEASKESLEAEELVKRQELLAINDQMAQIQSTLIHKRRTKSELEIVEAWLTNNET